MDRPAEIERRTTRLIEHFEQYLSTFDRKPAFSKSGQQEYHRATINLRRQLGSAKAALENERFLTLLRQTVMAWGIGGRGSVLVDDGSLCNALRARHGDRGAR